MDMVGLYVLGLMHGIFISALLIRWLAAERKHRTNLTKVGQPK